MTAMKSIGDCHAPELQEEDLQYFCARIKVRAGINLKQSKHELVRSRLRSRLLELSLPGFTEYRQLLERLPESDPEWQSFTNLLTTNKTDFFREPAHFEFVLKQILPSWLKTREKTFNVWSAASSTGEEPYTIAMILSRALPLGRDFRVMATDIDTSVLNVAANGVYPLSKRTEIPPEYQHSCIDLGKKDAQGWFRIKPHLKERIVFQQHNLVAPAAPPAESFDLVFCRNVMIYFGRETIDGVQRKLFSTMKRGGHLIIGHSESLQGLSHQWKAIDASIFRKGP